MEEKKFITNQKELAAAVGRTPEHLSAIKNRKADPSEELIIALSRVTGISTFLLLKGTKKRLNREFKEFFENQRMRKTINIQG